MAALDCPIAKSAAPNRQAATPARLAARIDRLRPTGTPSSTSWPPLVAASMTPMAMTARTGPEPGASVCPAMTEMTAAIAPSVEAIVEMIPTAPIRSAR